MEYAFTAFVAFVWGAAVFAWLEHFKPQQHHSECSRRKRWANVNFGSAKEELSDRG